MNEELDLWEKYDVDKRLRDVKKAECLWLLMTGLKSWKKSDLDDWKYNELDTFKYLNFMEKIIPDIRKHFESSPN